MTSRAPVMRPASDASLLLAFDAGSPDATLACVHAWFRTLRDAAPPWLLELHPAYASLLVEFDPTCASHEDVEALVRARASGVGPAGDEAGALHELRVRYGGEHGPDLDDVARRADLTPAEVVALHAHATYRVAFLGFAPGFAYLSGLDPRLATPRRHTPRVAVPPGSVAIGGAQAGIYASATPGGWSIIGRVEGPLAPGWTEPGDRVRFVPVVDEDGGPRP